MIGGKAAAAAAAAAAQAACVSKHEISAIARSELFLQLCAL